MSDGINQIEAYFDLRSPYSYLAIGPARELARRYDLKIDWWPYITDFQSAYGGEVEQRTQRDVAKLKYLYMDCRRLAKLQGLTIRSTTKLWDVTLASQAVLFAKSKGRMWEFCDLVLPAFWRREFDLESSEALETALTDSGLDIGDWRTYLSNEASNALQSTLERAERIGVFGAPTFIYRDEMFWGGDRLALLETAIKQTQNAIEPGGLTT